MKKTAILAICIAAFIAVSTGCEESANWDSLLETSPPPQILQPSQALSPSTESHSHEIDYDAAFRAFAPDTVMIVAGDYTVTWDELFFHIRTNINGMLQTFGEIHDWTEIIYNGMTFAETVLDFAVDNALLYKAVEYGVDVTGAALSAEDLEYIREDFENALMQYGSEEAFMRAVWEMDGISSRELFDYLVSIGNLANATLRELYGEYGELLSDEDAAAFTMFDGYLMAKHILRLRPEEGEDTAITESEEILDLLDNYEGDDFESYFDELMQERTDDGDGLALFPNGYLFQYGDMVPEFYDACVALEIGEYSGIVETSYGYHIIFRKPVDFDEIPAYNYSQYDFRTLRNITAYDMFDSAMYGWKESLTPEFTAEYNSIDFTRVFDLGGH